MLHLHKLAYAIIMYMIFELLCILPYPNCNHIYIFKQVKPRAELSFYRAFLKDDLQNRRESSWRHQICGSLITRVDGR